MYFANTIGGTIEITFQLLQQQNPWWFREEIILDDEKIADYEGHPLIFHCFSEKIAG